MNRLPTLFVSHGAPTFALEPGLAGPKLSALGRTLPTPKAVLIVSPHWMTRGARVGLSEQPAVSSGALILLFHGVGAQPGDLVPLGQALAKRQPAAWVVSVRSPDPADLGRGWQWFSVVGVTEDNRPARVAEAMPRFADTVRHWQRRSGVGAA
ncbi:MAG: hypothetical protein ACT6Q6_19280, partial [Hydrogenophaga sp.]